ncbi:hypothetical protein TRFO_25916 [Tritrichomonas foetus]|uniref:F5/8 type C domain-containing protein n=1 Tax=Tritrichomonas foetus TaxID=1144522 RepID=A0A1J4K5I5_9EUKA|nr:hypothetical protein TRFO_25916 [Tritrichomonas foetus]|eukprot:OHT06136.1 hypothetical protein TRFO_25916 [Tritrichomonas foetus]
MEEIPFPDFCLPSVDFNQLPDDFTLIYNNVKYPCKSSLAAILSKKIQLEMLSNLLMYQYRIPKIPLDCDIKSIASFLSGESLSFSPEDCVFHYIVASVLGISYLEKELKVYTMSVLETFPLDQILIQAKFLFENGGKVSPYYDSMSRHFIEDPSDELFKSLPVPLLVGMFKSIDGSVDFSNDSKYIDFFCSVGGRLLRYLKLDSLSQTQLKQIITSKSTNLNYLRKGISEIVARKAYKPPPQVIRCAYLGDSFHGIIDYLSEKCKANPISKNLISVKSAVHVSNNYSVNNIFEYNAPRSSFKAKANEPTWFIIDFKSPIVQIDAYSIKSLPLAQGSLQPANWKVYGSVGGEVWDKIDEQNNVTLSRYPDNAKTFVLLAKTKKYQFIKFDHPPVKVDKAVMCINAFELFGVYYV